MENFKAKLDPIGQYYAMLSSPKHPGQFMLSAYLTENIDTRILQQAVNDIMRRLPFLCGRLKPKFFCYCHELLPSPPKIAWMGDAYTFTDYYNKGEGHVLRVLYGQNSITLEAIHSVVDGRGLTKAMQALLVRYFEVLGFDFDKGDVIDCADSFLAEEWEDAYLRFYDPIPSKEKPRQSAEKYTPSYIYPAENPKPIGVILQSFNLSQIKQSAKTHGATVSEYLAAQIFFAIKKERDKRGDNKPITMMLPFDCRAFFPTPTLRSFVGGATIAMPETDDFSVMLADIRKQFAEITAKYTKDKINSFQDWINKWRLVPRVVKRWLLRRNESKGGQTTTFSNIGKVSLPPEIEARVEKMAFIIDAWEEDMPVAFGGVTVGGTFTLAITLCTEADLLVSDIQKRLAQDITAIRPLA